MAAKNLGKSELICRWVEKNVEPSPYQRPNAGRLILEYIKDTEVKSV
jgi:hypothetical protein